MGLHVLLLSCVPLDEVSDLVLQLVSLLVKLNSQLLDVAGSDASHLVDNSFPFFASVFVISIRSDQEQVDLILLLFRGSLKNCSHVVQELELCLGGINFFVFHHSAKRVTHDGDEHVEHRDLGDERC